LKNIFAYWCYATLLFGLVYVFIVPPFQSPDEPNHFLRIYHIASGRLQGEVSPDKREMGGYLYEGLNKVFSPFLYLIFKSEQKIRVDSIVERLNKPLISKVLAFNVFPNTARYAPTTYLPQVVVAYVLDKLDTPPLIVAYACRLAAFLFWFLMVYWAIRIAPVYKKLLMLLSFLPTSLAINSTMNGDVVSNALAFLIFALFLKFKFSANKISTKDAFLFAVCLFFLSWQKIVYFPLCFLILLVPTAQFGYRAAKIRFFALVFGSSLAVIAWWAGQVNRLIYPTNDPYFTTYAKMREECGINPTLQIAEMRKEPIRFAGRFFNMSIKSYYASFEPYLSCFGWEGKGIPSGLSIVLQLSFALFLLYQAALFKIWERIFLLFLGHGLVMLFLLSQHLHWACVGEDIMYGFGGKYYIPIYPVLLLALTGLWKPKNISPNVDKYLQICFALFLFVVQIDFLIIVLQRYYTF
jgi:uncharacterized membrane protein